MAPVRVLLVGAMGAGKSSVGRALADRLGRPYLDNDVMLVTATGRSARELAVEDGLDALHVAEAAVVRQVVASPDAVVAGLPASIADDAPLIDEVREAGHVVWLRARPETLAARVRGSATRPDLASVSDPEGLRTRRADAYLAMADQVVDVDERTPGEIAEEVLAVIGSDP